MALGASRSRIPTLLCWSSGAVQSDEESVSPGRAAVPRSRSFRPRCFSKGRRVARQPTAAITTPTLLGGGSPGGKLRVRGPTAQVFTSPTSRPIAGSPAVPTPGSRLCVIPGEAYTRTASMTLDVVVFQMSCDKLCIRTIHVAYTDPDGQQQKKSESGYNCSILVPAASTDVRVSFSVVGGRRIYKVDRGQRHAPYVKDAQGSYMLEEFVYASKPPQHVQYFITGTSLTSWVSEVDERERSENLLQMLSRDFRCIRSMHVSYTDSKGARQQWSGTGAKVKCHLQSDVTDLEVTFSVVGGSTVRKVDRRDPEMPWVQDANGQYPQEKFVYKSCPGFVLYEICGSSLRPRISNIVEHCDGQDLDQQPDQFALAAGNCSDSPTLFAVPLDQVPAIGGLVDLQLPHSEHLLPAEVALFEPTQSEFFQGGTEARLIFLNTGLTQAENHALGEFHKLLASRGIGGTAGDFPGYMEPHALRMLQAGKFNVSRAADLMKSMVKERMQRLPIAEADVLDDLRKGFIYWHGRDKKCRPCCVIKLGSLGEMARDKERAVRTAIFTLEYALRFAMVPGRVENWVVIIDLENLSNVISPWHMSSMLATSQAIGNTLEKVYCGRTAWLKIVNVPGGGILGRAINSLIPPEKKDKVSFPQDLKAEIGVHFEGHQLEQRYGGSAPDLEPEATYPFHFFPNCRGVQGDHAEASSMSDWEHRNAGDISLHQSTTLQFHQGMLWDESAEQCRDRWANRAKTCSLTPQSSQALLQITGGDPVQPCRDLASWMEIMKVTTTSSRRLQLEAATPEARCEDVLGGEVVCVSL
mmetsp:Transcript_92992/g.266616  ORF Transcript_92992/g.266616 Transcript_92992/m.266616 type:complete len:809 (-) Transcript_92992:33-2459(-)